jgi:hypothetical protein
MKRRSSILAASTILLCLSACSDNSAAESYDEDGFPMVESDYADDEAGADGIQTHGAGLNFHGYICTDDCSGHEAGYAWAENNDVTDAGDCGGNSNSFYEGCVAYAEEHGFGY